MTEAKERLDSLLADIGDSALRVRIEGSAMATSWGDPSLTTATDAERWRVALSTAERCLGACQLPPVQIRSARR